MQWRAQGGGEEGEACAFSGRQARHAAYAYWTPGEQLESFAPLAADALRGGARVLYVADDLAPAAVATALWARGVAVSAEVAAGRLEITSASALLFSGERFDPELALAHLAVRGAAARRAGAPLWLAMEMTWLLSAAPGIERALDLEARLSGHELGGASFSRLCAFSASREVTDLVADALRSYPVVITRGLPLANPYYRPWCELRPPLDLRLRGAA